MSSRPASGRRTETLFDNRYRIELTYPRSQSGETVRAYDTLNDLLVIIKRPALQDAPPMRTGQEQNILYEKRVLERLTGHAGIPDLLQTGVFRVGGQAHQYIVTRLISGESLDALVTALSAQNGYLPEFETLVIFSKLLEIIYYAHERKVVHSNIDPANVIWDRDRHQLGVIGWSKSAILEGDNIPAGATKANDIQQLGQLMYFVVSGGCRPEDTQFDLAGTDGLSAHIKTIVARASNPDAAQRYPSVAALKQAVDTLLQRYDSERTAALTQIEEKMQSAASSEELDTLQHTLAEIISVDPGYPAAKTLFADLNRKRAQQAVAENLHAVSVYITSGNMVRATAVLTELKAGMGDNEQPVLDYLLDAVHIMQDDPIRPLPAGLAESLGALLEGNTQTAGHLLATTPEPRPAAQRQQNLLASRLTTYIPDVVLLRVHLARLDDLSVASPYTSVIQNALGVINAALTKQNSGSLQLLRTTYDDIHAALTLLQGSLTNSTDNPAEVSSEVASEINTALTHALAASAAILSWLDNAVQHVYAEPEHAIEAIDRASRIDPTSAAFDSVKTGIRNFTAELNSLRAQHLTGDGPDIIAFLQEAQIRLKHYINDVPDPNFQKMVQGIANAVTAWTQAGEAIALGGRRPAIAAYEQAAEAVRPFNQNIAHWFEDYARRIEQTPQIEQFSANATLGTALQQGWELWDRGRAAEARAAAENALTLATTDGERLAAKRLAELSEVLNIWLVNDGPMNPKRTEQVEAQVNKLFLPHEDNIRRTFTKQMPDAQIYLKAMNKGIIEPMREASAAAVRTLFLHYVLRGMIALQQDTPDEAMFYREAALKTLPAARTHPGYQALDMAITRRQLIIDAVTALNRVTHVSNLAPARQAVRAPLAAAQLEAPAQAMQAIDEALTRWSEGNFRAARQLLDTASERITFAQTTLGKDLGPFKGWLLDLTASAELMQQARFAIEQIALVPDDEPNPAIIEAHQKIIEVTRRDLGEAYTVNLRQWRDTYNGVRDLYLDTALTNEEKLRLVDGYLDSPTLENQPALPIIRHWCDLIRREPEPEVYTPPSPAVSALYRPAAGGLDESDDLPASALLDSTSSQPSVQTGSRATGSANVVANPSGKANTGKLDLPRERGYSPALLATGGIVLAVVLLIVGIIFFSGGKDLPPQLVTVTPTIADTPVLANKPTEPTSTSIPSATFTEAPTSTPPTLPPTITRIVPTPTVPQATTQVPSDTPLPAGTQTALPVGVRPGGTAPGNSTVQPPTFAPTALGGDYDLLQGLGTLPTTKASWNKDWFGPAGGGWQLGIPAFKTGGTPLVVRLGPDIMTALYGVDAARKLVQLDASLELVSYDKSLLPTGQVYFGIGLESLTGPRAAIQGRLVQTNVLDLGINQNGQFNRKTQLPVTKVVLNVTIKRNTDGTITLYTDNQQLGISSASYAVGTPVNIYLYTSSSGIVVNVTVLKVKLQ